MTVQRLLVISLCLALLCSCAARLNKKMDSWLGHHYSELIDSWGAPDQQMDDGRGGRILVYAKASSYSVPLKNAYNGQYIGTYTNQNVSKRMFWVDADGVIYKWKRD